MKPVVQYEELGNLYKGENPEVGFYFYATVYGVINHPRLGYQSQVYTSRLVTLPDRNGNFETLNTRYERVARELEYKDEQLDVIQG